MKTKSSPLLPLLLVLMIVPFAAVTGCEREGIGTPDEEVLDDRDRAEKEADPGESLEDASVTAKVKTRLARDERTDALTREDIEGIEVETRGGVVTLKGAVDREGVRTAAEEIARATDGVSDVVNRITVGSGESSAS